MAAPTSLPNLTKVARSVEYALKQINNVNGYRTNGILVARGVDPTNLLVDQRNEYDVLNRFAGIFPGVESADPARTGGVRRKVHNYSIACELRIAPAERTAGLSLDELYYSMLDDLYRILDGPSSNPIGAAANILAVADPLLYPLNPNDGKRMSCINHRVADVPFINTQFPQMNFTVVCEFEYDRAV